MTERSYHCPSSVGHRLILAVLLSCGLSLAGCADDVDGVPDAADLDGGSDALDSSDLNDSETVEEVDDPAEIPEGYPKANCDSLNDAHCALPWPSDLYLEPSESEVTGFKLRFGDSTLPANGGGVHLSPELFEGLDGYGFGTPIIFDLGALNYEPLASEWEGGIAESVEDDSPTLLFKVTEDGLEQVPHFVEPDSNSETSTMTFIRPAVVLDPDSEYIVALRDLEYEDGGAVPAPESFVALRDRVPTSDASIAARRDSFEELFSMLSAEGVERDNLTLAWRFHTGSADAIHERLDRSIDLAFDEAPDGGAIAVSDFDTFVPEDDDTDADVNADILYRVRGEYTVPGVLKPAEGRSGSVLNLDDDGEVALGDDFSSRVLIHVPYATLEEGADPSGVVVYGHGLFGGPEEIQADHLEQLANRYNFVFIAVPMIGMAGENVDPVSSALTDLNGFPVLADALHQGILNHHLLTRFSNSGALETLLQTEVDADIEIDESDVHYFGGSQGGIFGQTIIATSPDLRDGALAVPGNNYVTLLPRSVNYAQFESILKISYPDALDRAVILAAIQLLWDRTDPVSYLDRLFNSEDYDGTTRTALMLLSKGDYQVAVLTNEIAARTYPELSVMSDYDERVPYGLEETSYPTTGSGMVLFDFGNPWPDDRGNRPPEDEFGDPHPRIAEVDDAGDLIETYLRTGEIIDVCGGDGCNPE